MNLPADEPQSGSVNFWNSGSAPAAAKRALTKRRLKKKKTKSRKTLLPSNP